MTGSGSPQDPYVITSSFSSQDALNEHILNPTGAHAATAISFTPSGGLTSTDVQDAIVEAASVAAAGVNPVGTILMGGWASAPVGYLLCDGTAYTTAAQPNLFAAIGYAYGGSGSVFNVPNLKGRVPVGIDAAQTEFDIRGESGGEKTHILTTAELAAHSHGVNDPGHTHSVNNGVLQINGNAGSNIGGYAAGGISFIAATVSNNAAFTGITTQNAGSGTAHNNLQPYLTVNFAIKA